MRVALDTNILAYAEGVNGEERKASAIALLDARADDEIVVPVQVAIIKKCHGRCFERFGH